MCRKKQLCFIGSEMGSQPLEGSEQGRKRIYVKDLSGGCEELGLWREEDGSRETSQEPTVGVRHMIGMAGVVTLKVGRGG